MTKAEGTPPPPPGGADFGKSSEPRVEIRRGDGSVQCVPLESEVSIGRSEGDVVIPDDPFLSGRHLRFVRRWGQVMVEDLGSTNGVFLSVSDEIELREGDEIRIGGQLFRFET